MKQNIEKGARVVLSVSLCVSLVMANSVLPSTCTEFMIHRGKRDCIKGNDLRPAWVKEP